METTRGTTRERTRERSSMVRGAARITSASFRPGRSVEPTLQEIVVALSFALDLTEGAAPGHMLRSCLLSVRLALAVGLDIRAISDLYYAALLKDVGCSSNSARMCQIVGGDDRSTKAEAKLADWRRPHQISTVRMLWKQVLPGAGALRKGARLLKMGATQNRNNRELITLRCDRGASIVRKLGLGDEVAVAVRHLDEHWDGGGYPLGLRGDEIPVLSRIMCVAQHLDAFCMAQGTESAIRTLRERSGRWFDPDLVAAAVRLNRQGALWQECLPGQPVEATRKAALRLHAQHRERLSAVHVDSICEAFADVVDAKSPFTFRHSVGVMNAAVAIGSTLGLSDARLQLVRRAALLHDVGKLSVSNTILDKTTRLTAEEFAHVKGHPALSAEILGRVGAFREIALIAGEHHEKLDGSGYPHGLRADDMSLESRLLVVADIYAALSEERPYREALAPQKIRAIMEREVPHQLDPQAYDALCAVMDDLALHAPQAAGAVAPACPVDLTGTFIEPISQML